MGEGMKMTSLKQQPKALYLLFFVKMWECFSFYGMRALMVLYLIDQMGMRDIRAYGIYALYCSLYEFGGILGGRCADYLLGLKKSIVWGGWLIAAGHICLSLQSQSWGFFTGLSLIVIGSGLFSTNISALLGLFYEEDDPRRERGFTLFYVGINVGALLASLVCGIVGELYGWHYGFGLAAVGMVLGIVLFLTCGKMLEGKGEFMGTPLPKRQRVMGYFLILAALPACASMIAWEHLFLQMMPLLCLLGILILGRKMALSGYFSASKLVNIGLYLAALAIFFAAEDQTASALLVFSERYATGTIAGIDIPAATLLGLNPFVIIIGGAIVSKMNLGAPLKLVVSGLLLASAMFALLTLACHLPDKDGLVPLSVVAGAVAVISMGEVLLAPAIFSYFSEAAPKGWAGTTMGLLPLGFSLGNALSGILSKSMAVAEGASLVEGREGYGEGFLYLSLLLVATAAILFIVQPLLRRVHNDLSTL